MDIRFGDHASFHRAALGMVGGSLLLGLALHPLTPLAPLAGGVLGIAAGAGFAHGRTALRLGAAAAATALLVAAPPSWAALAGVASLLALGLAVGGPRGARGALGVALSAAAGLVGMWCALRIVGARETAAWPAYVAHGAAAGAMGLVGVLAMVPRHLRVALDPVAAALRGLPAGLDPEVKGLCDRAAAIWQTTQARLGDADPGRALVRDGVLTTLAVAARSAEVKLAAGSDADLERRTEEFDRRIAAATDAEVKAQYQAARAALDDQRRYREHIRQGRERLVARMHNHVTTLEKFQLAATGLEATRATEAASARQLDELSQDVAASGEALAEIELGVPPREPAPAPDAPAAPPEAAAAS